MSEPKAYDWQPATGAELELKAQSFTDWQIETVERAREPTRRTAYVTLDGTTNVAEILTGSGRCEFLGWEWIVTNAEVSRSADDWPQVPARTTLQLEGYGPRATRSAAA